MAPTIRGTNPLDISKRAPVDSSSPLENYLNTLSAEERQSIEQPVLEVWRQKRDLDTSTQPLLTPRQDIQPTTTGILNHGGAISPTDINNRAIQAVFAIIACSFVLAIIWFFFVAKNGGFVFRQGDWEEYKSTVLRRKGPNGTTLSNATKSTKLGGGSVVGSGFSDQDSYRDDAETVYTGTMSEMTSSTAPIMKEKQRSRAEHNQRNTAKDRKQREMAAAGFEGGHDRDVRAYMKEKPARVGGINATSDTMHYGTDYTESEPPVSYAASQISSQRQHRRTSRSPEKRSRRDFSYGEDTFTVTSSQRSPSPVPVRIPATSAAPPATPPHAARPPRYHNSTAQTGVQRPAPAAREPQSTYTIGGDRRSVPGSYPQAYAPTARESMTQPLRFDRNSNATKTYNHPIPYLAGQNRTSGFRRGMGSTFDD